MIFKVKVYLHSSIQAKIDDDFLKCQSYFKAHNVDVVFDFQKTDVTKDNALMWLMMKEKYADCVMYVYNRGIFQAETNGLAFRVSPITTGIYLATSKADDAVDYSWKSFCHEIMHCLFFKFTNSGGNVPIDQTLINGVFLPYYKNEQISPDGTGASDGNFAKAWEILAPYIKPKYKNFKESEVIGLSPKLVEMLDRARDIAGIPFIINSGLRTSVQNAEVGGVEASSHLDGLAVDLRARNSNEHFIITKALMDVGFTRISKVYANHIHVDLSLDKPQKVLF